MDELYLYADTQEGPHGKGCPAGDSDEERGGLLFLGAGLPGQDMPQTYEGKWDAPEKTVNHFGVSLTTDKQQQWLWPFDSFWMGNAHAGIHCELRGTTYSAAADSSPSGYPDSWNNRGKGGFG